MLRDREDAAHRLAARLAGYRGHHPLVLAIPRGGVPMGRIVADALDADLDVVLVHKLGAPGHPEFALGAVNETGTVDIGETAHSLGVDPDYLAAEAARQLADLRRRRALYSPERRPIDPAGRTVVVVDDGAATGETMLAALRLLGRSHPARLVVAIGVAPPQTVRRLREVADEVICLEAPCDFWAVGEFYQDFATVEDEEVIAALRAAPAHPHRAA